MLNKRRASQKSLKIIIPVGDGTAALREEMNQSWILAAALAMRVLFGEQREIPHETLKEFAVTTLFENFSSDSSGQDTSAATAQQFKNIIKDIFHNREISVRPDAYQTLTNCPWASIVLQWQARTLGLHFLLREPFFELFREPTEPIERPKPGAAKPTPAAAAPASNNPFDILRSMTSRPPPPEVEPDTDKFYSKFGGGFF